MRNLKRALSLVMAAAMLIGMMVVSASAASYDDFTDKDEIVNTEAVSTMYALGVINGKEDGSYFDPQGMVSRAEMAKMIVVALHGGVDPVLGVKDKATFSDIKGHWAESYIEYCAANEIIAGRGNGKFDPNANVTGSEAAKMILVSLGYKSDVFQFTGDAWEINVNTSANDVRAKLYDGLTSLRPSQAITRDTAAQMMYNGVLKAQMLTMTPAQSITTGEVTYQYNWSGTMLNMKYDADVYVGVISGNEYASVGGGIQKEGQYHLDVVMKNDQTSNGRLTVAGNTTPDMLGKSYKVIIKNTQKAGVYNVVYGEPSLSDMNNIYTVSTDKTTATATAFANDVKAAGISTVAGATIYEDFKATNATTASEEDIRTNTANGKIYEVIDNNNDGAAELVLISTPYIGKVTAYNEKGNSGAGYITIASKGSEVVAAGEDVTGAKFEKVVGIEDLAKDDIVSYIVLNDKFYVTKLETVNGTVTAQSGTDTVKLDGVTYKQSVLGNAFDDSTAANLVAATALGKDATLYLDASGYVVYTKAAEADVNYLYVTNIEGIGDISGVKAKAVLTDGTTQVITVTSLESGGITYKPGAATNNLVASGGANGVVTAFALNRIYKYSVTDGNYSLKALAAGESATITSSAINQGQARLNTAGTTTAIANSKTIFLLKSGSSWTVYTGVANVPTMNTASAVVAKDATTNDAALVVVHTGAPTNSKSIYILSDKLTAVKDGDNTVYTVKALVDGEYTDSLVVDGATAATQTVDKGLYTGDGAALTSGKLPYALVDNKNDMPHVTVGGVRYDTAFYADPVALTSFTNGNVTGLIAGHGSGTAANVPTATGTLTVTENTKVIIITGDTEDKILEGSIDDLNYDANAAQNNSVIVMTRASNSGTNVGYYQAGVIYIIR